MKYFFIFGLLIIFLIGCESVICNTPYIRVGRDCCLDDDNNRICDKDEESKEESKIVITEPKVVKKFVCWNGAVVEKTTDCPPYTEKKVTEPKVEEVKEKLPTLIDTNEIGTVIQNVSVQPACKKGVNGGEIYFKVGTVPTKIAVQIKQVGGEYSDFFTRNGAYEQYNSFAICNDCKTNVDFKLKEDKIYIMRLMFDQTQVYDRIEYSNEHIIDTRSDSLFMLKICNN